MYGAIERRLRPDAMALILGNASRRLLAAHAFPRAEHRCKRGGHITRVWRSLEFVGGAFAMHGSTLRPAAMMADLSAI
jgi:hypothetical protein